MYKIEYTKEAEKNLRDLKKKGDTENGFDTKKRERKDPLCPVWNTVKEGPDRCQQQRNHPKDQDLNRYVLTPVKNCLSIHVNRVGFKEKSRKKEYPRKNEHTPSD